MNQDLKLKACITLRSKTTGKSEEIHITSISYNNIIEYAEEQAHLYGAVVEDIKFINVPFLLKDKPIDLDYEK